MSILDAPLRKTALKLINRFGATATLTIVTSHDYTPATGQATSTTDYSIKGVVESYAANELGDLILAGDVKFTIAAKGIPEPGPSATVKIGSTRYQVVRVDSVYSGDQAALYVLQLRK